MNQVAGSSQEPEVVYAYKAELDRLRKIEALVNEQAEDDGLWFIAETAAEGYLQQELRRLHAVIESGK